MIFSIWENQQCIIGNYRDIIHKLDFYTIETYAGKFRNKRSIMNAIQLEVM